LQVRVDEAVVGVAVEDLAPGAGARKPEPVRAVAEAGFVEADDHHHIAANPRYPALEGPNTIFFVHVKYVETVGAQRRVAAA